MISGECFTREYIERQGTSLGVGRYVQVEKSIHALALLGHLTKAELQFVFKGGTSLLLYLPRIRRLSIDIDIMCDADDGLLETIVEDISTIPPFIRHEKQERGARGLPERRHFKFFYISALDGEERHVLLDVVPEDGCNLACIEKPIVTEFITVEEEVLVTVPTIDALIGDKLTAFAPHTIGVPFRTDKGRSMAMQVVKQLFDVGELFNEIQDVGAIKEAYLESYKLENKYRGGEFSIQQTLCDTKNVSLQLCCNGFEYEHRDNDIVDSLLSGIKPLRNHLVRDPFRENLEAKIAAAKAYLLVSHLEGSVELTTEQLSFDLTERLDFIQGANLSDPSCLNRLKPILPEAFYYLALGMGV